MLDIRNLMKCCLLHFLLAISLRLCLYIHGQHKEGGSSKLNTCNSYLFTSFLVFFYANLWRLLSSEENRILALSARPTNHRKVGINRSGCHWLMHWGIRWANPSLPRLWRLFSLLPFVAPPGRALVLSGRAGAQQRWKSPCRGRWNLDQGG